MAVCRPDELVGVGNACDQLTEKLLGGKWHCVADRIRNIDGTRAGLDDGIKDLDQKIDLRAQRVFCRKFHVVGIFTGNLDRLYRSFDDLIRLHAQLFFHMDRAGRDEGVNPASGGRLDRFASAADVVLVGTR